MFLHPFLVLVLTAFGVFIAVLFPVSLWSARDPAASRRRSAQPSARAATACLEPLAD